MAEEIKWQAPEFEYREKGTSWFWLSIIIAVFLLALGIWQKNFLFVSFVLIAEMLVLTWAGKEPRMVEFKLDAKGLTVPPNKFYAWSEMEKFSAEEDDGEWQNILVHFKTRIRPALKIYISKERLPLVRKIFRGMSREVDRETSLSDALEKFLRF